MFDNTFSKIDQDIWKDAGIDTALDYTEQTSWILFLKYLDDYEKEKEIQAKLNGKKYTPLISKEFRWNTWAVPRTTEGKLDIHDIISGSDLLDFVNNKLFPYHANTQNDSHDRNSFKNKIGEIFSNIKNEFQDGYILRNVIEHIDGLNFETSRSRDELGTIYELKLQEMGNAGQTGGGGQFYTPRPLIGVIVEIVDPKIGETIYDGAVGSGGFLCEAFDYIQSNNDLTNQQYEILQTKTLFGKEKKSLPYLMANMNMILHGIETPNIQKTNTLEENILDYEDKDRVDVILANPPFGSGGERKEIQNNFPIKTSENAYLFLQHFLKILKTGGRAGIIIKNTFLSNDDNASKELRKELLENFNLHTILVLPQKVFTAGVKTVVLFFDKGSPTKKIWYYDLALDRNLGKTNPLNNNDLEEFKTLQKTKADSDNSWTVPIDDFDKDTWDLSPANPNVEDTNEKRTPSEIIAEIEALDNEAAESIAAIKGLL